MSASAAPKNAAKKQVLQKHWAVTLNNPDAMKHYAGTSDATFEILLVGPSPDVCKHQAAWWMGQLEKAPLTGMLHLQMHVCFKAKVGFSGAKHFFDQSNMAGAHLEPVKDLNAHLDYVVKAESREMGPFRSPGAPKPGEAVKGKRNDLDDAVKLIVSGTTIEEMWRQKPLVMVKMHRGLEKLAFQVGKAPARPGMMTVVLYGKPRTGKSTLVAEMAAEFSPEMDPFYKPIGKWFCGYHGQKVIIMDDFDGKGQACREIKNICDKTPCIVEMKGGQVYLRNELVLITSNRDPRAWYSEREESIDGLAVLERCLFFRVEDSLVRNQGMREGFGLNETGRALFSLIRTAMAAEGTGEGKSGFRGESALKRQETRYGMYGEQIIAVANYAGVPAMNLAPAAALVPNPVWDISDSESDSESSSDADADMVFEESDNEEGYTPRAVKRARTQE